MNFKNRKALTLVESLVSIILLGAFISSFLGAFFVSRLSALRAQHRLIAMNMLKEYMEEEIRAGYNGGKESATDYDYYATVNSLDPLNQVPIETRTVDGKIYTITPDPYYPDNAYRDFAADALLTYDNRNYKITGFIVTWTEDIFGQGVGPACSERANTYIFDHET